MVSESVCVCVGEIRKENEIIYEKKMGVMFGTQYYTVHI